MSKIIAIANQKGGVAKTTTACSLGVGLSNKDRRVLLIDCDPQANLTEAMGYQQPDEIEITLATVIENIVKDIEFDKKAGIIHHEEGVDILPCNIELSGVETSLVTIMSGESVLSEYIEMIESEDKRYYDWIPSMVYSLFFDELYHLTAIDESLHETLPEHLTFLMDEFANVTLPDSFVEKLSTMRSRNLSAVIIDQNLIQLKRKFPKFDMDKDLIGNCSIIDILGAPDMDSCEYLSKHFGTMTIHKASDSDSKDHKGSSSRSEDVMQKSLLSAEDIFAMNKDGECAIVVKGAKPLFQMKCKMEVTPFVKLLCRKENPYRLEKRLKQREIMLEYNKLRFLLSGKKAKEEAHKLKKDGVPVIKLTMDDMQLLKKAVSTNDENATLPVTNEQKKMMEENYKKYLEAHGKKEDVNYEAFRHPSKSREEDYPDFLKRVQVVRKLYNRGFSNSQLLSVKCLIMDGYTAEDVLKLFDESSSVEEIENYMSVVS